MADATVTSTLVTNLQVRRNKGLNAAFCLYNFAAQGVTVSTSLVVQMVPVPHGARILDLWVRNDTIAAGGFVVGDSSLSNRFISTTSLAAAGLTRLNVPAGVGWKVSLTASDENSFDTIDFTFNGAPTSSASCCIAMAVFYVMD